MPASATIGGMRSSVLLTAVLLAGCSGTKPVEKAAPAERVADIYRVKFETSKGDFTVEVTRAWAPIGADRFHELVKARYFDEARFYRVIRGFVAQFGIHRDSKTSELWRQLKIVDDPQKEKNRRGTLSFAQNGPNTRTTQIFINLADNKRLDGQGFVPFGRITEGIEIADKLAFLYGETAPSGAGPDAAKAEAMGNSYLISQFPRLDHIKSARVIE